MRTTTMATIATGLALVFILLFYSFRPGGTSFVLMTDIFAVIFSLAAVLAGVFSLRMYGMHSLHGRSLMLILIGTIIWFSAELLWIIFMDPIRYVLEAIRFAGYVPMTIGFFYALSVSDPSFREDKKTISIVFASFVNFTLVYLITLPIILGQQSLIENILTNGYIVADFTLLFGIAILLKISYSYRGGYLSRAWLVFILAFLAVLAFDINFAMNYRSYTSGDFSEILWLANYILISFGFFFNTRIIARLRRIGKKRLGGDEAED